MKNYRKKKILVRNQKKIAAQAAKSFSVSIITAIGVIVTAAGVIVTAIGVIVTTIGVNISADQLSTAKLELKVAERAQILNILEVSQEIDSCVAKENCAEIDSTEGSSGLTFGFDLLPPPAPRTTKEQRENLAVLAKYFVNSVELFIPYYAGSDGFPVTNLFRQALIYIKVFEWENLTTIEDFLIENNEDICKDASDGEKEDINRLIRIEGKPICDQN